MGFAEEVFEVEKACGAGLKRPRLVVVDEADDEDEDVLGGENETAGYLGGDVMNDR
jgi:hypothetical protein